MKKLALLVGLVLCVCTVSFGQRSAPLKSSLWSPALVDTAVNTTARDQKVTSTFYSPASSIKIVVTKISGTVAGKVASAGSYDGVRWVGIDSVSATNVASQTLYLDSGPTKYRLYRIRYTPTGTMSASFMSTMTTK